MRIFVIQLFSLLFFLAGTTPALQAQSSGSTYRPPRLYINSVDNKGDYFEIQYEITAPGYVELHLMGEDDEKLWVTGKVTDRTGVDVHRIPTGPLKPGKRYTFVLKYKGEEYSSFFYTNG